MKKYSKLYGPLFITAILFCNTAGWSQTTPALPGGASSLQETFQDWQVACVIRDNARHCSLSQQQTKQGTNQRVLAVELTPASNNSLGGVLILPFGLLLNSGATMQIDDKPISKPLAVRTCLPTGCIVALNFDKASIDVYRAGSVLKIGSVASDTDQPVLFTVSLKGFNSALDRIREIAKVDSVDLRK
jgi:invasion protein IalB